MSHRDDSWYSDRHLSVDTLTDTMSHRDDSYPILTIHFGGNLTQPNLPQLGLGWGFAGFTPLLRGWFYPSISKNSATIAIREWVNQA